MHEKVVGLNLRDREVVACIGEGLPDYQVMSRFGITQAEIEETMDRVRARAADSDDRLSAAVVYERALRRRAENAAASLNARFQALLEASSEAILVVNGRTGNIRDANENAAKALGYSRGELVGQSCEMLVPEATRAVHVAYRIGFLTSVRKRQMGYHPPIFALRKDGTTVEVAISLTANRADDDVMVVVSDSFRADRLAADSTASNLVS